MAELASYNHIQPVTVKLTAVAVTRGVRLTLDSSGTCAVSAIGVRGDYISITSGAASEYIQACPMSSGKVPCMASEALVVGDILYSAASGKISKTSGGGAVVVGRCVQASSGDGVLGEMELESAT